MVRVRMATTAEIAGILALDRATAEAPHWAEEEYCERLAQGQSAQDADVPVRRGLWVAMLDGGLAGYAAARVVGEDAELESVAVAGGARRRGVGTGLCRAAMRWAAGLAAQTMYLEVRASSTGAQSLYMSLGFETAGRRARYYSSPVEDAVLMRVTLTASNDDHAASHEDHG